MKSENPKPLALVVDDEPDIRELIAITLGRMDVDTVAAADISSARKMLLENRLALCLTDMRLPDGNGLDLITWIQEHVPEVPVAMITAHGNMESAVTALKNGAFDFVSKPVDINSLRALVEAALRLKSPSVAPPPTSPRLMGTSKPIQRVRELVAKVARSQAPIHISGASGTGKELAARLIHESGPRADAPFVPVNCGAIPTELMESEFFGHKKGSFTGAHTDKTGLFQTADSGTLFLDEVADLPLHMQVKLLRVIQEKAVRPVGAPKEIPVDVRILSATHRDLQKCVNEGMFREDLYYRINVIELHLPALSERKEDIPELVDYILDRMAYNQKTARPRLSPGALDVLVRHDFPGNVRELENMLERAMTLSGGDEIGPADLQPVTPRPGITHEEDNTTPSLTQQTEEMEKAAIRQALEQSRWNKTEAAKLLGLTFRQLRYRIKKLELE
ncbi:MAG TPA: sigma-54 dependent transcriptional regulator [Gammaproteobacteria bacterium]|nr:sigma-54 dependent transcriptional regulator [Gammaproteobacteria bacterium]